MVKQARELVRRGVLGDIRKVIVEYSQGWLATDLERTGQKQAAWRTDPKQSGASGCLGDIGSHAEHLARYITGLRIAELCADLTTFVEGRKLEDDGNILVRFGRSPQRCKATPCPKTSISPPSPTASRACSSSRPPSRAPGWAPDG